MQKKWVELFEKVIGRKPSPEEFMAGKACGFDLKQIQSIAGNAPEENLAHVEEPVLDRKSTRLNSSHSDSSRMPSSA